MPSRASYRHIADHLRVRIHAGVLKSGERLPSFQQLRRQFGAAPATVSRAFSALESDGLIIRRMRKGIFVAQSPRVGAVDRRIAICGWPTECHTASSYWTSFLRGVRDAAGPGDFEVTCHGDSEPVSVEDFQAMLIVNYVLPKVMPPELPLVTAVCQSEGYPNVGIDYVRSGRIATSHLLALGHRRIGFIGWLREPLVQLRAAGYRTELFEHNIHVDERLIYPMTQRSPWPDNMPGRAQMNMDAWFEEGFGRLGCTAIIAQNDWHAMGIISCLQRRGLRVPEDISVVGFDNEPAGAKFSPRVTSISGDMYMVGLLAMRALINRISDPSTLPVTTLLPVSLVERESTGPAKPMG